LTKQQSPPLKPEQKFFITLFDAIEGQKFLIFHITGLEENPPKWESFLHGINLATFISVNPLAR
jgi:hypothetical protein